MEPSHRSRQRSAGTFSPVDLNPEPHIYYVIASLMPGTLDLISQSEESQDTPPNCMLIFNCPSGHKHDPRTLCSASAVRSGSCQDMNFNAVITACERGHRHRMHARCWGLGAVECPRFGYVFGVLVSGVALRAGLEVRGFVLAVQGLGYMVFVSGRV